MKTITMQLILVTILFSSFSFSAIAQEKEFTKFDINGLYVTTVKYTKAQIVEKLGQPSKYQAQEENYDFCEYYSYNNSQFAFENGELIELYVEDPQFKIFEGRVAVGYPLRVVENLPGCRFVLRPDKVYDGQTQSELWIGYSESPVQISHKNGVIVSVGYSDPI